MASNTTEDITERLNTIASLTSELKSLYYKRIFYKWNGIYKILKESLESLMQDVKENSYTDLSAMNIFGCLEIIRSHTTELKRRRRSGIQHKKKASVLLSKSKSVDSICKSIMQNINNTIQELQKNESIVIDSLADHFKVSLDLESSSQSHDSLVAAQDNVKFQEEYDELVPIECINENQVLDQL